MLEGRPGIFIAPLIFVLLFCSPLMAQELDPAFQQVWSNFSDICGDVGALMASDNRNQKTMLETVTFREPKYMRLLEEAREILGTSATTGQFAEIEKLRVKNRKLEHEIVELRHKRISAPESSWNPLAETRKSIDKKLASLPEDIEANKKAIAALKQEIIRAFNAQGLTIGESELDYFLVSAEGDEILHLVNMAENMKRMQKVMEKELEKDGNNVDMARMYAGMYLVSLDAYTHAHDTAVKNISGYREKLGKIADEAKNNYDEAKRLKSIAAPEDLANLDANAGINARTMEIAEMYDSLLERRAKNLADARNSLGRRVDVARNTYKTVLNGSSLIGLISQGSNDYALLTNFEMPELRTIYDDAMLNAFADIAEKIRLEQ